MPLQSQPFEAVLKNRVQFIYLLNQQALSSEFIYGRIVKKTEAFYFNLISLRFFYDIIFLYDDDDDDDDRLRK